MASPGEYVFRLFDGRAPVESEETIGPTLEMGETMMMGLRLVAEGVEFARFQDGLGLHLRQVYQQELSEVAELGLIEIGDERVRLTNRGCLLGNQAFFRFLPE